MPTGISQVNRTHVKRHKLWGRTHANRHNQKHFAAKEPMPNGIRSEKTNHAGINSAAIPIIQHADFKKANQAGGSREGYLLGCYRNSSRGCCVLTSQTLVKAKCK